MKIMISLICLIIGLSAMFAAIVLKTIEEDKEA